MQKIVYKKILFIGLGGAGQRHLRLFKENLNKDTELIAFRSTKKTPTLNSDFTTNSNVSLEELYNVKIYNNLDDALNSFPDLVVISTPSSTHMHFTKLCAEKGIDIFVEKPLSDSLHGLNNLKDTIIRKNILFQVGFQRRYHPHFKEIKKLTSEGQIGAITNVAMTVSSYIPFWHPYEDFKELYACRKDLGGGVLLTEIHEFDLCIWFFGKPISVTCIGGTYSNVGLDVEDTAHVILDYGTFLVQVNLTFWQKHLERSVFIAGEDGCLSWNQDENLLKIKNYQSGSEVENYAEMNNDSMFLSQVKDILNPISDKSSVNLDDSYLSISIVMAAKKSMEEKKSIYLDEVMNNEK
jgi:predicted dehydrogenase